MERRSLVFESRGKQLTFLTPESNQSVESTELPVDYRVDPGGSNGYENVERKKYRRKKRRNRNIE